MTPEFPLRTGTRETFATVRNYLAGSGYREEFLTQHFRIPSIHFLLYPYGLQAEYLRKKYEEGDSLPLFVARVFLQGIVSGRAVLEERFGAAVVAAMEELRLLVEAEGGLRAPVVMYPAYGLFVVSDRGFIPEGPGYRGKDFVMSGTEHICRQFIASLPQSPCERLLEMGTGSGLAAMMGSVYASQVWAVDITERAVRYADFNRLLNGIDHLEVVQGDLFAPVAGRTFDRIVSNPPFEPPLKEGMIFSVGGEDGEAIIKRLVTEAPDYLEPGGRLYCQVCGTDRDEETFDQRIRTWLGDRLEEFDTSLFTRLTMKPNEYAIQQILGENQDSWKLQEWNMFYHKLKATQVVVGHLVVQRRKGARKTFQERRAFGPKTAMAEMEWITNLETRFVTPGFGEELMGARLDPGKGWELHVRHGMKSGKLEPLSYTFFTTYPFEVNLHVAPWMAMLVSRCDGKMTGADHFEFFKSRGNLPREEFERAVCALLANDFLRMEGSAPPAG